VFLGDPFRIQGAPFYNKTFREMKLYLFVINLDKKGVCVNTKALTNFEIKFPKTLFTKEIKYVNIHSSVSEYGIITDFE